MNELTRALIAAGAVSEPPTYSDDVFAPVNYLGNSTTQTIETGIRVGDEVQLVEEAQFLQPGTYNWTVPAGVTSISMVAVQPGATYTVGISQDATTITYNSVVVCRAQNGNRVGDGGGDGGNGGSGYNDGTFFAGGGGGGAGGYMGNGGSGGNGGNGFNNPGSWPLAGSGAAAGGGGGEYDTGGTSHGYHGGGVGIFGLGSTGSSAGQGGSGGANGGGVRIPTGVAGRYGGGSGGDGGGGVGSNGGRGGALAYKNNVAVTPGTTVTIVVPSTPPYAGGGAARIIWGAGRAFPSTNVEQRTNVIAGRGGLVMIKNRASSTPVLLYDTVRGAGKSLWASANNPESTDDGVTAIGHNSISVGATGNTNQSGSVHSAFVFARARRFFDVVTWTGNGVATTRAIPHSLGSTPGCIIIKPADVGAYWLVWHRGLPANRFLWFATSGSFTDAALMPTQPDATNFYIGSTQSVVNQSGIRYVAYVFGHDESADGLIQCGTFTAGGGQVNLGWEPQFVLWKQDAAGDFLIEDGGSGFVGQVALNNNLAVAANASVARPNAAGMAPNFSGTNYYIAIRRPNKSVTAGTEVFVPAPAKSPAPGYASQFAADMSISGFVDGVRRFSFRRLPGVTLDSSAASIAETNSQHVFLHRGFLTAAASGGNSNPAFLFRRARGFFDLVFYTGNGAGRQVPHGLGVTPEMMIIKSRNAYDSWVVGGSIFGSGNNWMILNNQDPMASSTQMWGGLLPTASVVNLGTAPTVNSSGIDYVAMLFASTPGLSKVGSYTGNGGSQSIDCGFTSGARFVMIRRIDVNQDWLVFDVLRGGIVAASETALALNNGSGYASADAIDPLSQGFVVNQEFVYNINFLGGSFIYLAIA